MFHGRGVVVFAIVFFLGLLLAGCGGAGGDGSSDGGGSLRGFFLDSPVSGLEYSGSSGSSGVTDIEGGFSFQDGEVVTFGIGNVTVGSVRMEASSPIVTPVSLVAFRRGASVAVNDPDVVAIVRFLMSADRDGSYRTIDIGDSMREKLGKKPPLRLDAGVASEAVIAAYLDKSIGDLVSESDAVKHLKETFEKLGIEADENVTGGGSAVSGEYRLLAWSDLGMHCMDGRDYSLFSILPPYNNLLAQLVKRGDKPEKITSGVAITYEALPSFDAKWNTTSATKTNFWEYVQSLFGMTLEDDVGLEGARVQSKVAQPLYYDSENGWWIAGGIPVTPRNDDGTYNRYPMVKVVAKDVTSGEILAETTAVLPVSDEMDCRLCHASNGNGTAKPSKGWATLSDGEKEYKTNILRLHDERHPDAVARHIDALRTKGWRYDTAGLEATVAGGTSILCASCHRSNALPGTGVDGIVSLTHAMHRKHTNVVDPGSGERLGESSNRTACYTCHPGSTTECLRGAMGSAKSPDGTNRIECQSCHGSMQAVGDSGREGWLDLPGCQSCHQHGKRYTVAVTDMDTGAFRSSSDDRFATDVGTPVAGRSLYRFSTGHGGLQCSACHGSTHAIYPSIRPEDNLQSIAAQGYAGPIRECTSCHTSITSGDELGGPHGMHLVGQPWVHSHGDLARFDKALCSPCHGTDYRGTDLARVAKFRKLYVGLSGRTYKYYLAGDKVGCYDCHNGPNGP